MVRVKFMSAKEAEKERIKQEKIAANRVAGLAVKERGLSMYGRMADFINHEGFPASTIDQAVLGKADLNNMLTKNLIVLLRVLRITPRGFYELTGKLEELADFWDDTAEGVVPFIHKVPYVDNADRVVDLPYGYIDEEVAERSMAYDVQNARPSSSLASKYLQGVVFIDPEDKDLTTGFYETTTGYWISDKPVDGERIGGIVFHHIAEFPE